MNLPVRVTCAVIAVLCTSAASVVAQPALAEWLSDSRGCKVANPHPQPIEAISWSGGCRNGYADGPGTIRWFSEGRSNGTTSGTFKDGKLNGQGSVTLPHAIHTNNGSSVSPSAHTWAAGSRLEGEFADNQLIGDGVITSPNGQKTLVNLIDGRLVRR